MARKRLKGVRVALLAAEGFEDTELSKVRKRLRSRGAKVHIVSPGRGKLRGLHDLKKGRSVTVDRKLSKIKPGRYDALVIPGGRVSPDTLRQNEEALDLVRAIDRAGKPIAALSGAASVLISADRVKGRRLAAPPGQRDDIENAGGKWKDRALVVHRNWLSTSSAAEWRKVQKELPRHIRKTLKRNRSGRHVKELIAGGVASAAIAAAGYGISKANDEGLLPEVVAQHLKEI